MIRERHVLRMKIAFPSIDSNLACSPHMYICLEAEDQKYKFVKCQTLKPYMLGMTTMKSYCDEVPDIRRNPFKRKTRIDCDKAFSSIGVKYDEGLLTTSRPDICNELFSLITAKLSSNVIRLNSDELVALNALITYD